MRALILAAGHGRRLRPLTDRFPKPLLRVDGKSLLARQIEALHQAGIAELCINLHWLGEQIYDQFKATPHIRWQRERTLLDTGGAIARALPWLCHKHSQFMVVNADIYHDFALSRLSAYPSDSALVVTSTRNQPLQQGDFGVSWRTDGSTITPCGQEYVYTGMALMHRRLFADCATGKEARPFSLFSQLEKHIAAGALAAEVHHGNWDDLGTMQRLAAYRGRLTDPENKPITL